MLFVERLENREVPAAPSISNLSMRLLGSHVVITGKVQDEAASQAAVNVSGAVSGTASVAADGSFEFIRQSAGGLVTVIAEDIEDLQSSPYSQNIAPPQQNEAPFITITSVEKGPNKQITVSGQVYDENPGGLTVTLTGAASGTTTTNSSGAYSVNLTANLLGGLYARTVDSQGLQSNVAEYLITNTKPVITAFNYEYLGQNKYRFYGTVTDDWSAAGLTVLFAAEFSAMNGLTATTDANGNFSKEVTIPVDPNQQGYVHVTVTDCWGLTSDVVSRLFSQN
jgi:hypothetical protein